jgi:hypothetical protein
MRSAVIAAALVLSLGAASSGKSADDPPLSRARWMAGCWELSSGRRRIVEMWMPPAGNMMIGASRTTVGDSVVEYEQTRMHGEGQGVVFTALPARQPQAEFRSIELTDSSIVVENLGHDFPHRVMYRRRGADSLIARIEGMRGGTLRGVNFPMRRISCETG